MDETSSLMVSACATKSLNHEQQRRIEVKCIELEAMLEEQGLTQAEISDKVHQLRTILTEGARQMSQTDDKKLTFISDTIVETQKKCEIEKDACSIASETIGSSHSSGKTSPLALLPSATPPDGAAPIKYKKRKRKSRDSSISSDRKKKYVKKSKKKSPSEGKEKSHKKSKKEKEKYMAKKSYRKDMKQKKSPDSDGKKKRSKKRSRKHRSLSARDKSNGREVSPSSQKAEEKCEGKKKKRSRSKERRRQSRKRKREKHRSRERSHHNKQSSSSSESNDEDGREKNKSSSLELLPILAPQPSIIEEIKDSDIIQITEVPVQNLQSVDKYTNEHDDFLVKKNPFIFGKIKNQDNYRKERLPEIAPFRIEPRNNLLLREKITRPFSSPFKKSLDPTKQIDLTPKVIEKEVVVENFSAAAEETTLRNITDDQTEEHKPEEWDEVDAHVLPAELKAPESKRCWSSSSSSSRSSRAGSICSTCSSDGSRKYESGRDRKRKYSRSPSSRSSSSCRNSRSRSPSIPRRRGSPSFLDRRRITRSEPFCYYVALVDIVLVLVSDQFHTTGHLQCHLRQRADATATMDIHRLMTIAVAATRDAVGREAAAGATVASIVAEWPTRI